MHELGIAIQIMDVVRRHLPADEHLQVRKIHLRIGKLTAIVPEYLATCLEAVTRNTPAQAAELVFTEIPAEVRCRDCDSVSEVDSPPFVCFSCNSHRVEVVSGHESFVDSIEVEKGG